jgi:hypothetical protein
MGNSATTAKNNTIDEQTKLDTILNEFDKEIQKILSKYGQAKYSKPAELCQRLSWQYVNAILPDMFQESTLGGIAVKLGLDVEKWGKEGKTEWGDQKVSSKAEEYKKNLCENIAGFYLQKIEAVLSIQNTLKGCNDISISFIKEWQQGVFKNIEDLSFKPGGREATINNDRIGVARDAYKKLKELQKYTKDSKERLYKFVYPISRSRDFVEQRALIRDANVVQGEITGVCNSYLAQLNQSKSYVSNTNVKPTSPSARPVVPPAQRPGVSRGTGLTGAGLTGAGLTGAGLATRQEKERRLEEQKREADRRLAERKRAAERRIEEQRANERRLAEQKRATITQRDTDSMKKRLEDAKKKAEEFARSPQGQQAMRASVPIAASLIPGGTTAINIAQVLGRDDKTLPTEKFTDKIRDDVYLSGYEEGLKGEPIEKTIEKITKTPNITKKERSDLIENFRRGYLEGQKDKIVTRQNPTVNPGLKSSDAAFSDQMTQVLKDRERLQEEEKALMEKRLGKREEVEDAEISTDVTDEQEIILRNIQQKDIQLDRDILNNICRTINTNPRNLDLFLVNDEMNRLIEKYKVVGTENPDNIKSIQKNCTKIFDAIPIIK